MRSNEKMIKYKHDIIGQFKDLNMAISTFEASDFDGTAKLEVFHAVHEVLLKMVKTSRNTIAQKLNQEIILVVSDEEADLNLLPEKAVVNEMKDPKVEKIIEE